MSTLNKNSPVIVSIITIVLNGKDSIEKTINSVISQKYKHIEYIIIDGASTDGTLEIIKKHNKHINNWISEPDDGVYCAMNKGISLSNGDIIGIINSGDIYYESTIDLIVDSYNKNSDEFIIFGGMNRCLDNGSIIHHDMNEECVSLLNTKMSVFHPSTFVSAGTYHKYGMFDSKFYISGDYDFIKRVINAGINYSIINNPLSLMESGGVSERPKLTLFLLDSIRLMRNFPLDSFYICRVYLRQLLKEFFLLTVNKVISFKK